MASVQQSEEHPLEPVQAAQEYAESIVDTIREPLLILDPDLRVKSANRAFYKTFQVSPEETENCLIYDLGDGTWNIPALRRLLDEILPHDTAFNDFEMDHNFENVGHKILLLNARKVYHPGIRSELILLAMEDITERRREEAARRETEERLHLLVDTARDYAMLMLDTQGRIVSWNSGAERIMGWREDEVLGHEVSLIFPPEAREEGVPEREMGTSTQKGRAEDVRWHLKKDGSRFWADGVMSSLRDDNGKLRGFGKVLRDATARRRAEEELAAAYQKQARIAETLQRSLLLAPVDNQFPGLAVETRYESALEEAEVGGDFFDAFALGGGQVALVVGDVSGKGLRAAAHTAEAKYALRAFLHEYRSPGRALEYLNNFIADMQNLQDNLNETFIVLALAVVEKSSGQTVFAVAGAEPPLILRAAGHAEPVEISGHPLGISPGVAYQELSARLGDGDTILMATDGITEARQGHEFLGSEGMAALATQAGASSSLTQIGDVIMSGARAYAGGILRDDACLLLARRMSLI